jgi:hypothetical protein
MISINLDKARQIHLDRMRSARKPKLEELDLAYMRAQEAGSNTSEIVAAKQALRDVTKDPAVTAAQSPEDLKAAWPTDLLGNSPYTPTAN